MAACGIKRVRHPNYRDNIKRHVDERVFDVNVWCTKEWLTEHYCQKFYGAERIARIVGRTKQTVQKHLKRFGIKQREWKHSVSSHNPKCTLEWLTENYIKQCKSTRECAIEAGVNGCTITDWLIKFGILPRDMQMALAKRRYKKKYGTAV